MVASVTIVHRKVIVHWTANAHGDAACCPSLDYATQLTLKGHATLPSHTISYGEQKVANQLAAYVRGGNKKAALTLATAKVVSQMFASFKAGQLGSVYGSQGSPLRDPTWGSALDSLGITTLASIPAWLRTADRYAISLSNGSTRWTVIRLKHLGWRHWQADYFVNVKAVY